jgi:hypothetical protein
MRYLGLLLVAVAVAVSACDDKSDAPQVQQGGTSGAAARRWAVEMPDFTRDLFDALAEHAAFTGDILATWGTPQQPPRSRVIFIQARFNGLRLRAQALPEGTPEINAVNLALVRGLDLAVQAYDSYLAGIEEGRFRPMAHGDELMAQAQAEFARARPALEKVLGVPTEGTIVAEGKRISPALYVAQAEADKALDLLMDSAPALKHRDFKEAAKLATEAKRHVDKGLSGLEALEPPDYDELQAYLKKTIDGYRLLSAGVASYVKGIKKLDPKLIREAAQKAEQGLQEVSDATEELFRFLRSQ